MIVLNQVQQRSLDTNHDIFVSIIFSVLKEKRANLLGNEVIAFNGLTGKYGIHSSLTEGAQFLCES